MENKQKAIEKAYGEHWEAVKDSIIWDGWCVSRKKVGFEKIKESIEIHTHTDNSYYWRPKSLQGIETNNGWIKIESEDDLPKEDGFYWVIDTDSNEVIDRYFENGNHNYFKQFSTHYQPIIKPLKPIY